MSDLLLFGLQYLGRSSEVEKVIHTDTHIFLLENGEIFMCDLREGNDFEKLAPGHKFQGISFDSISSIALCIGDGHCLHFYDHNVHKLSSYTMNSEYITSAWSPSKEIVAFVTKEGKLKTFSFNSEGVLIGERGENYISNNNPQHCYMNLSWETKTSEIYDRFNDSEKIGGNSRNFLQDTSKPTLAWRGTNTMFVVNFYVSSKVMRVFKIFSDSCKYLFEGIPIIGLQSAVAWKPGLSFYITMAVAKKNKMMIGLFEKSGALNDIFTLRDNFHVSKIEWSADGNVLAVLQKDDNQTPLSLYYYHNKQWTLKQYLLFEEMYVSKDFHWIPCEDSMMYPLCILTNENLYKYVFKKGSFVTSGHISDHHMAAYATVDGHKLDLSLFIENVLVLSSSTFQKELPKPINNILFHPTSPKLVIMDCDTTLYLCEYSLEGVSIIRRYEWDDLKKLPLMLHHMYWGVDDYLYCIGLNKMNPKVDKLFMGDLKSGSSGEVYFLPFSDINSNITFIGYSYNTNTVIEQRYTEVQLHEDRNSVSLSTIDFKAIPVKIDAIDIENINYIIALTKVGELYINFQKIMSYVTSFQIHHEYLLLTKQGQLTCARIKETGMQKILTESIAYIEQLYSVPIEIDTVIVTGIPNTPEIVLQVAKHKFETVRLKPIIIDKIEEEIHKGKWSEAYNLICNEELDVNILVDLDFDNFLNNIPKIVESFQSPEILNKIIDGINENNVFMSDFKQCISKPPKKIINKTQLICEKFLTYLGNNSIFPNFITTIVTCYMRAYETFGLRESFYVISKYFNPHNKNNNFKQHIYEVIKFLKTKKFEGEILHEALLTFNVGLIEYVGHNLHMWNHHYDDFFSEIKNLDFLTQRIKINKFIQENNLNNRLGYDKSAKLARESMQKFSTQHRNIGGDKNNTQLKLAEMLESESRTFDACKIYEKQLGHLESTCSLLARKHSFLGAVRIAKKHRKEYLIEKDVLPVAENHCNKMISLIEMKLEEYVKLINALIAIREKLLQNSRAFLSEIDEKTSDVLLKEKKEVCINTDCEAEYMETLKNLYEIIDEVFSYKDEVREICYVLLSLPKLHYRKCKTLHDSLYEFHIKIIKDIPLIWPSPAETHTETRKIDSSISDDVISLCQYLKPPINVTLNWILPYFINK